MLIILSAGITPTQVNGLLSTLPRHCLVAGKGLGNHVGTVADLAAAGAVEEDFDLFPVRRPHVHVRQPGGQRLADHELPVARRCHERANRMRFSGTWLLGGRRKWCAPGAVGELAHVPGATASAGAPVR